MADFQAQPPQIQQQNNAQEEASNWPFGYNPLSALFASTAVEQKPNPHDNYQQQQQQQAQQVYYQDGMMNMPYVLIIIIQYMYTYIYVCNLVCKLAYLCDMILFKCFWNFEFKQNDVWKVKKS